MFIYLSGFRNIGKDFIFAEGCIHHILGRLNSVSTRSSDKNYITYECIYSVAISLLHRRYFRLKKGKGRSLSFTEICLKMV